ncbi:hypothetical protein [Halomarina litorea]|uniref:hypothetical protein n=1 Tax=Halomarina litorea TaxID=2961595 RepID=UPI0020C3ED5B|nr:hypothetical protein [Halomarina sp. BCD28]
MIRDRYARLGGWIRDKSAGVKGGIAVGALLVFFLVVQPLAQASQSIGREDAVPFFIAGVLTITLAVTVFYVLYVAVRSLIGDVRGRGTGSE